MKGLLIKEPWIDLILQGKKTWEIRSSNTNIRGKIALIKSKTGKVFGTVEVVDSFRLDLDTYRSSTHKHCITENLDTLPYPKTHAWVLQNPVIFKEPIPYTHPQGAVIWVNLGEKYGQD